MSELSFDVSQKTLKNMHKDLNYLYYAINALPYSEGTKAFVYHYAVHAAKSSRRWKKCYYWLSALIIVIPILSSLVDAIFVKGKWVSLAFNSIVTICASVLALFRCHEKWARYRAYLEKLVNLIAVYPVVTKDDPENGEKGFVQEIGKLNTEHQVLWVNERKKDKE